MTLVAVGDCIITRNISHRRDPDFLALVELLRGADCAWGNCELVFADSREVYPAPKGGDPHAIAPPWGADELAWLGVDFVGMANNHILDFGNEGLFSTLANLERVGIPTPERAPTWPRRREPGLRRYAGRTHRAGQLRLDLPRVSSPPVRPTPT